MHFYVVRHSETEFNKKNIVQGQLDSQLTKHGRKTAENLGKWLKDKNISKIYSSDLGRCLETSENINEFLKVKIIPIKELRERNYGDLNGKPVEYVKQIIDKNDEYLIAPNGESLIRMKERVINFIQQIFEKEKKTVLIVTHNGCLTALLSHCHKTKMSSPECKSSHEFIGEFKANKKEIKIVRKSEITSTFKN